MPTVQLFRDCDPFNIRFDAWTARVKNLQGISLITYFDEITTSKTFGYFIWDSGLSDLAPFFSREYFSTNWPAIFDALKIAGTFEAYLLIIKSALGGDTAVTFENPDPSHLIINIDQPTGNFAWVAYDGEDHQVIPFQGLPADSIIGAQVGGLLENLGAQNLGLLDDLTPSAGDGGSYFIFQESISELTINETVKLIELLNVNGVFVEVNFVF